MPIFNNNAFFTAGVVNWCGHYGFAKRGGAQKSLWRYSDITQSSRPLAVLGRPFAETSSDYRRATLYRMS